MIFTCLNDLVCMWPEEAAIYIVVNFRYLQENEIEKLPTGLFSNLSKLRRL